MMKNQLPQGFLGYPTEGGILASVLVSSTGFSLSMRDDEYPTLSMGGEVPKNYSIISV